MADRFRGKCNEKEDSGLSKHVGIRAADDHALLKTFGDSLLDFKCALCICASKNIPRILFLRQSQSALQYASPGSHTVQASAQS
jgi:hypothetical protein